MTEAAAALTDEWKRSMAYGENLSFVKISLKIFTEMTLKALKKGWHAAILSLTVAVLI